MVVNAIFDDVKIYNVQDRLDVVQGQTFQLEILEELPAEFEIFTNNDPILELNEMGVTASALGVSKIRFMSGSSVIKDLEIWVVDATHPAATTLNGTLGQPIPK
jgi:hypothetical protein